ncbi:hypothetical protein NQ317_012164 [Molorchus minor]|uniref:SAM-dependent MTase RsmB/NOP-type domain-containing protein n=1 Tax=Molorchus minor TaxID=1323400 RepID=A0ABQ9K2R0_9CUCU|nr:hypothetical protein NQ317_012164 [Molorchus minor]
MPYPNSPFEEAFNAELIISLNKEKCDKTISNGAYEKTLSWLCSTPKITSYRVNTLQTNPGVVLEAIKEHLCQVLGEIPFTVEAFNEKKSGVAVEVKETISGCPPLGDKFLPTGWALLQNLPSIICVKALNPKPNETIIDLCASPGNKTTHIAELMQNKGILVAIDKTSKKVAQLNKRCEDFGAKVSIFQADSIKIIVDLDNGVQRNIKEGPPFLPETFDRILLDAPCSALGKRPQLANMITKKVLRSYVPLQKKLFETAVRLLKINGTMVYSTCTISLAENEGVVAWALRNFKCLKLIKPSVYLGGPGWEGTSLTEQERCCVQRFGPEQEVDSVGFFFACFIKEASL